MGKEKPKKKDHDSAGRAQEGEALRAHDNKESAAGGGSNQSSKREGVEMDATGGRRAKHNDDEAKYRGRGGGNRGKGA
jgi:hypothetical protein